MDPKVKAEGIRLLEIMNEAVKEAQKENHRLGIRNVYELAGRIVYIYPNGDAKTQPYE